jgi:hypothetical protein
MKASRAMRDTAVAMLDGQFVGFCPIDRVASASHPSWSTMIKLQVAGYVVEEVTGIHVLTETGKALAAEQKAKNEAARIKRNLSARGRADALRSLGLKRTPYGWE